jgi:hypothetical protein
MFDISKLSASSIEASLIEWDEIGRQEFLDRHSLHGAFKYVIISDGNQYDAKAVLVRAARIQASDNSLAVSDFGTTEKTIAEPLRNLGFDVRPKEQVRGNSGALLSESFSELVATWEGYRARKTTQKNHPVHVLVVDEIPSILESWTPSSDRYKFDGSDGKGNILRTPWFAILNLDVTDSATKGYYLVYLVSADMQHLVLALGFGAYQFEKQYGRGKKMFTALESAVVSMRINSQHLLDRSLTTTRSRVNAQPVKLDNSQDFHLTAYERCSIYSLVYQISELPAESELKRDYLEFLNLYENMCTSLLLADVDSYVYEAIETRNILKKPELRNFEPRKFKNRKANSGSGNSGNQHRYSKKSDKVGKLGEEVVFEWEKKKLIDGGRAELAAKVIWHREDATNRTPGWDITSYDLEGQEIFIEVKASEGQKINDVELTINEWIQAGKCVDNGKYVVYLVSDIFSCPLIEKVVNPAKLVADGVLTLNIARYQLLLGSQEA